MKIVSLKVFFIVFGAIEVHLILDLLPIAEAEPKSSSSYFSRKVRKRISWIAFQPYSITGK